MSPSEVATPGRYRYRDQISNEPKVVDVRDGEDGLELHFPGRDDYDLVRDVTGDFEGPL